MNVGRRSGRATFHRAVLDPLQHSRPTTPIAYLMTRVAPETAVPLRARSHPGRARRVRRCGGILCLCLVVASSTWTPVGAQERVANTGGHQFSLEFLRPSGGPVVPFFEGWQENPDGSYELVFGYWNVNTEEVLDIPLGPDNLIEPREYDGVQPTHFLPVPDGDRRHWGVFTVTVPPDFGARDVVWTLTLDGESYSVPGRLTVAPYQLDGWDQPGRLNVAPALRLEADGTEGRGFAGVRSGPVQARVGEPLPLTVWAERDNPYREDERPILLRWMQHQGPGSVVFEQTDTQLDATGGQSTNRVTFDAPGAYVLRVLAYNSIPDFEFFCCWTNGFLEIEVTR